MAKYLMEVIKEYEVVTEASEMIFTSLVTGEEVGKRLPIPESRTLYRVGHKYTARNKKERDNLLKTGNWKCVVV